MYEGIAFVWGYSADVRPGAFTKDILSLERVFYRGNIVLNHGAFHTCEPSVFLGHQVA